MIDDLAVPRCADYIFLSSDGDVAVRYLYKYLVTV